MTDLEIPPASKKTEWKVKAASYATFFASLVRLTLLQSTVTDMVPALPDWLETPAYSLLLTAVTWVTGFNARSKPDNLSPSTVEAIQNWMRNRAPRFPRP